MYAPKPLTMYLGSRDSFLGSQAKRLSSTQQPAPRAMSSSPWLYADLLSAMLTFPQGREERAGLAKHSVWQSGALEVGKFGKNE